MRTEFFVSDLHLNSTVALFPPSIDLDDGGKYRPSPGQRWLFSCWESALETVEKRRAGPVTSHIVGDALEADIKNRSKQLITRNTAVILDIGRTILEPLAQLSAVSIFYRGTAAHVGTSADLEEELAHDLEGLKNPDTGRYAWWGNLWRSEKVPMDIAHHPKGGGGVKSTRADRLARACVEQYANRGEQPPALLIRAHLHEYGRSYDHFITEAVMLPCWTLATEYIHRIEPHSIADIGGVMVHTSAGHYEIEPVRFKPKPARFLSAAIGERNGNTIRK